jgi:hypothetical protein
VNGSATGGLGTTMCGRSRSAMVLRDRFAVSARSGPLVERRHEIIRDNSCPSGEHCAFRRVLMRNFAAVSPMYFVMITSSRIANSGSPSSPAMTRAVDVFPVPGGPMNNNLRAGRSPVPGECLADVVQARPA